MFFLTKKKYKEAEIATQLLLKIRKKKKYRKEEKIFKGETLQLVNGIRLRKRRIEKKGMDILYASIPWYL